MQNILFPDNPCDMGAVEISPLLWRHFGDISIVVEICWRYAHCRGDIVEISPLIVEISPLIVEIFVCRECYFFLICHDNAEIDCILLRQMHWFICFGLTDIVWWFCLPVRTLATKNTYSKVDVYVFAFCNSYPPRL